MAARPFSASEASERAQSLEQPMSSTSQQGTPTAVDDSVVGEVGADSAIVPPSITNQLLVPLSTAIKKDSFLITTDATSGGDNGLQDDTKESAVAILSPTLATRSVSPALLRTSSPADELEELLSSEVTVDVEAIRTAAYRGVPARVRGEIWLYLLGIRPSSKQRAIESSKQLHKEYAQIEKTCADSKRIGFETRKLRDYDAVLENTDLLRKIRNVVAAYINDHGVPFSAQLVRIACPIAATIDDEAECYGALCAVLERMAKLEPLRDRASRCMGLIDATLLQHCEDEELDLRARILSWLEGFAVLNLPLEAVLVLWDVYIARGFWFHTHICVALLDAIKEDLYELDEQELGLKMNFTNMMDIHEIVVTAENMHSFIEGDS